MKGKGTARFISTQLTARKPAVPRIADESVRVQAVGRPRSGGQHFADALDELFDVERLLDEIIGAGLEQIVDFVLVDDTGDDNDLHVLEAGIFADGLANDVTVDVGEHVIEDDQVGQEFLGEDSGVVAGAGGLDLKPAVAFQDIDEEFDDLGIVIDDQDFELPVVQGIRRVCRCPS